MKLTRRQLRRIILKEFKDTSKKFDINNLIGSGGQLPPISPPDRGDGGGKKPTPCEKNKNGIFDRAYNYTMNALETYLSKVLNMDEFQYLDYLLSSNIISLENISTHRHGIDFLTDELIYNIAMELCSGRLKKIDIDEAFKNPKQFIG